MEEFQQALDEFAREKRPTNPEIARVLREVRRARAVKQPRRWLWLFAGGGWAVAAVCLLLLVRKAGEPPVLIQAEPTRLDARASAPALPEPASPAPAVSAPERPEDTPRAPSAPQPTAPRPSPRRAPAPLTSAPETAPSGVTDPVASAAPSVPRVTFEQSLQLARGHVHRIESVIEVLRESGTSSRFASEQRCFAVQHRRLLGLQQSAREQVTKIAAAAQAGDTPSVDLELERLVAMRKAADATYLDARLCIGAP